MVSAVALVLACDRGVLPAGKAGGGGAGPSPGDAGTTSGGANAGRVPRKHRAAGSACPQDRGSVALPDNCFADGGADPGLVGCLHDAECTAGTNGRCMRVALFGPCVTSCSYDGCFDDGDCPSYAPCACRASAPEVSANSCLTASNCQVDSDCGVNGYCSPSVPGELCFCPAAALCEPGTSHCYAGTTEVPCACGDSCGHGYFCHTEADGCVDDEDCGTSGTCNYDTLAGRWQCAVCWAVP